MNKIDFTIESPVPIGKLPVGTFCRKSRAFEHDEYDNLLLCTKTTNSTDYCGVYNFDVGCYDEVSKDAFVIPCDAEIKLTRSVVK